MSMIRQSCPACQRTLELPADAVGRLGQCPVCQTQFTIGRASVPEPAANVLAEPTEPASEPVDPFVVGPPQASADEPVEITGDATGDPFSVPLDAGSIEEDPTSRPSVVMQPATQIASPTIAKSSIEDIVGPTVAIFSARWTVLVLACVIVGAVMAFVIIVPFLVISAIADAGGDAAAGILALVWFPTMLVLSGFFGLGLARVAIAVACRRNASLADLTSPFPLVLRCLGGVLIMAIVIGGSMLAIAAVSAGLGSVAGNQQVATLVSLLGTLVAGVLSVVSLWLLWSWIFILADGKGTTIGSIRSAIELTLNNRLTSALLVLLAIVLTAIGTAFCNVGHVVTVPMSLLLLAIAYKKMTDQPIDDPREEQPREEMPPPAQPEF